MNLTIPFNEIKQIIDEKVKQPISFEFVNDHTLRVNYELNLFITTKKIGADLEIKGIKGSDLYLCYANGNEQMMVSSALKMLGNKIPEGLLEEKDGGNLILHLAAIDKVKEVFDKIDVQKITVLSEGIDIAGQLKL
jgi:hypothetical protein